MPVTPNNPGWALLWLLWAPLGTSWVPPGCLLGSPDLSLDLLWFPKLLVNRHCLPSVFLDLKPGFVDGPFVLRPNLYGVKRGSQIHETIPG